MRSMKSGTTALVCQFPSYIIDQSRLTNHRAGLAVIGVGAGAGRMLLEEMGYYALENSLPFIST
jgi:hypothetical protein